VHQTAFEWYGNNLHIGMTVGSKPAPAAPVSSFKTRFRIVNALAGARKTQ
jgi:hypothetical protein